MSNQTTNLFHKLILTYLVFTLQLILQITCKNITISTQNITIPHNTFKFNSKSATHMYLCIPQIQGDTVIILYVMKYGKNLYDVTQMITQLVSNNSDPYSCDITRVSHFYPQKNTDYNLVMVIHQKGSSNTFNYKAQIGSIIADSPFNQTFSSTFSNNNIYYTESISYQPCISYYQLTFNPPTGAPSINLSINRTIAASKTTSSYIIENSAMTVTINNITADQIWSYQYIYNKQSYNQIYSYMITIKGILFTDDKLSTECCLKYYPQLNCNPQPPQPPPQPIGAIVGGVIGGVLFLIIATLIVYYLCRRKKVQISSESAESQKNIIIHNQLALKKM